jgi:hypothetical protein
VFPLLFWLVILPQTIFKIKKNGSIPHMMKCSSFFKWQEQYWLLPPRSLCLLHLTIVTLLKGHVNLLFVAVLLLVVAEERAEKFGV